MSSSRIPKPLHNPAFRFVLLYPHSKRPQGLDWQAFGSKNNHAFDSPTLTKHLDEGGGYGIVCGEKFGNLCVIDCDKKVLEESVEKFLPKTFSVRTGRGGRHFYYICKNLEAPIRLTATGKMGDVGDVQWTGKQVVAPGTVHENGNIYQALDGKAISETSAEEIKGAVHSWIAKNPAKEIEVLKDDKDLDISSVVDLSGLKKHADEHYGEHPIHGSDTGVNFWVNPNKGTWHCFRHDTGGGAFAWLAVKEGIIDCSEATKGALRNEKFKEVLKIAKKDYGYVEKVAPLKDKPVKDEISFKFKHKSLTQLTIDVLQALQARRRNRATELIVEAIREERKIYTIMDDEKPEMWVYHEGIYVPQGKSFCRQFCRTVLGESHNNALRTDVVVKVCDDTYIDQDEFFKNDHTDEIAVQNGILNVLTRKLRPFTPEEIFFNKLPVKYDPEADCPAIKQHFKAVLKYESDIPVLQEVFGYTLLKDYKWEKAIMFVGDGRNGKGKTISLLGEFLGADNIASVPLQQFESDLYAQGELFNKMANLAGDLDSMALKNTGPLKTLTGRDTISAPRKFLTRVHFKNYAKLIFATNTVPPTYDATPAFYMRWVVLEFPFTFLSQKEIDVLKENDRKNVKVRDPDIIKKLTTQEELNGLLNYALDGLDRLIENKGFSYNQSTEDVKKLWTRKSSSFSAFLMDCIEEDGEGKILKRDLRSAYSIYCHKHKLKPTSDKEIKYKVSTVYGASEGRESVEGTQLAFWWGIKFNEKSEGSELKQGFSTYMIFRKKSLGSNTIIPLTTLASFDETACKSCLRTGLHLYFYKDGKYCEDCGKKVREEELKKGGGPVE